MIDRTASEIYNYYKNLGSSRHQLRKRDIFQAFNLNNSNASKIFLAVEAMGVVFNKEKISKKDTVTVKKQKNPSDVLSNLIRDRYKVDAFFGRQKNPYLSEEEGISISQPKVKEVVQKTILEAILTEEAQKNPSFL